MVGITVIHSPPPDSRELWSIQSWPVLGGDCLFSGQAPRRGAGYVGSLDFPRESTKELVEGVVQGCEVRRSLGRKLGYVGVLVEQAD